MAITVNGNVLRNLPEQVSKNTEDILELQEASNNYGIRITALEQDAIALATFADCNFTGTSNFAGPLVSSDGFTFSGAGSVGGDLSVGGNLAVTGSTTLASVSAGNASIGGTLTVSGAASFTSNITASASIAASGSITADKIKQASPNNVFSPSLSTPISGLTYEDIYTRFVEINGVLLMIVNFKLKNDSGSSVSINAGDVMLNGFQDLGSIAASVIDMNGNGADIVPASDTKICVETAFISDSVLYTNWQYRGEIGLMNVQSARTVRLFVRTNEAITVANGSQLACSGRVAMTII